MERQLGFESHFTIVNLDGGRFDISVILIALAKMTITCPGCRSMKYAAIGRKRFGIASPSWLRGALLVCLIMSHTFETEGTRYNADDSRGPADDAVSEVPNGKAVSVCGGMR
jgi:hypothetical protein